MDASAFVFYWMLFAVLVPVFSALVLFLGWKAGYLKDQDRLRYLALWAEVPEEDNKHWEPRVPASSEHTPGTRVTTRKRRVQADENR